MGTSGGLKVCGATLSVAALWLGGLAGCSNAGPEEPVANAAEIEVEVVEASLLAVPRRVRVTGTLFGQEQATIAAKVSGRITAILRDVGDAAPPGEALAQVDQTDFVLERDERQMLLQQTLAELGLSELPPGSLDVEQLPAVERARLQAANAEAKFRRGERLHGETPPLISDQDFADLRTSWDVALADQRMAVLTAQAKLAEARTIEAQLQIAQQRLADTTHAVPQGEVRNAQALMEGSADRLEYVVTARLVSIGDLVQVGTPLFRLVDPDPVKLRAAVPERQSAVIQAQQAAMVSTDAHPQPVEGRVTRVNPAVNPQTRTFEVEILVSNPDGRLKPGSFARADIEVGIDPKVVVVPADAIVTFAGVSKVFIVEGGKAMDRPVTIGESIDQNVEIVLGLKPGEQVVLRPPQTLTGGAAVRPRMAARLGDEQTGRATLMGDRR